MSSYFDDATRRVTALCKQHEDTALVQTVTEIENTVINDVNRDTGDREFPEDLRERIQGIIARWNVGWPVRPETIPEEKWHKEGRDWLLTVKSSRMIDDLHSAYHAVASRRIRTRFGMLYDSPRGNVHSREEWEKDQSP